MAISTANFNASYLLRQAVQKLQGEMAIRQTELSTGKLADATLTLGARSQQLVSFQQQDSLLETFQNTNKVVGIRLEQAQTVLSGITSFASDLRTAAMGLSNGGNRSGLIAQAQATLSNLVSGLNTSVNGEYIFAGLNSSQQPIADYFGQPGLGRQAINTAFSTAFGMPQGASSVASITPTQMANYLDGPFAALFADPQWGALWSSASNVNATVQVAPGQNMTIGGNANDQGVRKLMMAFAMVSDTGLDQLNTSTAQVVIDRVNTLISGAVKDISGTQAIIGLSQSQVEQSTTQMTATRNALAATTEKLEGADPFQTATRINELQTQLESAYRLTAQFQQLSLAQFL